MLSLIEEMRQLRERFFDRMDWQAFWCCFGVAFVVYFFSLGPSVGLEDAGELATAAHVLGVPHPPGYPLWTMIGWCFCRLFGWVTWQGYANPAWAVSLFSALSGAVASGLMALLAVRSGRDLLVNPSAGSLQEETDVRAGYVWWGGVTGSLCFAFSPVMWSQSVIVEVYALGALFMALVMLLAYRWLQRPSGKVLIWLGLVFGLGLTNYQVLLLGAFPIGLLIFLRKRALGFSFLAVGIPLALTIYVLLLGALPSADAFSTPGAPVILRPEREMPAPWGFYGALLITLAGVIGALWLRVKRSGLIGAILAVAAVLLWGEIGFRSVALPQHFQGTLYPFWRAWLVHAVLLGGLWAICWPYRRSRQYALAVTVVQLALLILLQQGLLLGLEHPTTGWFWWGIIWNGIVLLLASRWLFCGRQVAGAILAAEVGLSVYAYMPLVSDALNPAMNWGYARTWEGFKHAVSRGQYEAIAPSAFFSKRYLMQLWDYAKDLRLQFSLPVIGIAMFGTGALVKRVLREKRVQPKIWLLSTVLFFIVMSALLVALANPSGDLQDGFIQKVKFISSHGVFALWIGYGLMMTLWWLGNRWKKWGIRGGYALVGVLVVMPFVQNALNGDLVHRMGASEQTQHDFGWQFGAYMLGGAPAIIAELSSEEEPLPDPFYPPPMAQDAVLFGGTDPGRFVPTYMVYAAGFRPDIFVLTQNALADPTYMNVERDLYGDRLWLPTADQVRDAFVDYVDEVQAGKRTTRGKIVEENGRMRITGAAAVMDINEALSQQLYERNPNAFYVEESYAMQWMQPLLEPAGLAMALRKEPEALTQTLLNRDADFWDWMVRRLTDRSAYRRDFAAKKSFSKLRSSIAGMYAKRAQPRAAARAFQDALRLYPASSESVFRTIQDLYLPGAQLDSALRLARHYRKADPNNRKVPLLEARLETMIGVYQQFNVLSEKLEKGKATTAERCELALVCEELGLKQQALAHWKALVSREDLTARDARDGAIALQRLREFETAVLFLKRVPQAVWPTFSEEELVASGGLAQSYGEEDLALGLFRAALQKAPESGRVWLGVALYYYGMGNESKAYECMRTAVQYGAAPLIEEDAAVADIFLRLMQRFAPRKGIR